MPAIVKRALLATAVAALSLAPLSPASSEPILVPATEELFISAGCPPEATGTCTSTRWLGLETGDATSNFITAITPVDEVFYRAEGSLNWRDYASDDTVRAEGYPLRAAETINTTVAITAGDGAGLEVMVHARIEALVGNQMVTFGPLDQKIPSMLPGATEEVDFAFEIPDNLEGKVLKSPTFFVAVHGINVQAGYIDQQGGSTVEIPYWVEEEVAAP